MSEIVDLPPVDLAEQPRVVWIARGRLLLFRATAVVVEATLIGLAGKAVLAVAGVTSLGAGVEPPNLVAFAYALGLLITGATPAPPRFDQRTRPFGGLALTFGICALTSMGPPPHLILLGAWFGLSALGVAMARQMAQVAARAVAGAIQVRRSVAFVGNSPVAAAMIQEFRAQRQPNVDVLGFFDDREGRPGPLTGLVPRLGTVDNLVGFTHDHELDDVFVALPWSAGDRISAVIDRLRFLPLTVRLLPDHLPPGILPRQPSDPFLQREQNQFKGVVMPTLMVPPMTQVGRAAKRLLDLVISSMLLLALSPLFLAIAVLIKLDSRGPIFFTQPRSGHFGRPFRIIKFRSLHVSRMDAAAETLVSHGDSRVTRVGRFIRKYSIDEIPQILNVFVGEMSLVGPRPHAKRAKANGRIYAEILDDYMLRYRVKPGMTGWAQVNGWRGNTDTEEKLRKRVEFDFAYITNWSVWLDLRILAMTFQSALFPPSDNA